MRIYTSILSLILLLVVQFGWSQQPIKYGLKAGLTIADYQARVSIVDLNIDPVTSFYVTAFADIPLAESAFSIQPGISFQGKGGKLGGTYTYSSNGEGARSVSAAYTERPYWLEIPVNLVGRTEIAPGTSLFVGAGPYIAFGVGGQWRINTQGASVLDWVGLSRDLSFGNDGALKSTDFGLNFLAGVELISGFSIQGGYGLGLTQIGSRKMNIPLTELGLALDQKNRVWRFGVAKTF